MSRYLLRLALVGAALMGFASARPAAITANDHEQPRLNQPAPIPAPGAGVAQTFVARRDGLSAVEVMAVVYPDGGGPAALTLRLQDAGGVVAERAWTQIANNAPLRLEFEPQPGSAGETFTLELLGPDGGRATVWAHSLDAPPSSKLRVAGLPQAGSLRYSATYTLLAPGMAREALDALARLARLLLPFWLLLFAPGQLVLAALPYGRRLSAWARQGLALALSLSLLPLAWLWTSLLPAVLPAGGVAALYVAIGAVVVGRGLWTLWRARPRRPLAQARQTLGDMLARRPSASALALAGILLVSLAVRLLAIRDLSFPAWVDSPHHAFIIRLLMQSGRVPADFQPLLPGGDFFYHFGVHVLFAAAAWLTRLSVPEVMLWLGQVLNSLMPLAVYTAAELFTRRRGPALLAAAVVGWVSFFPAYYVTWGRYSQLAGLLLLAPALGLAWRSLDPAQDRSARWRAATLLGVLAAGLLLVHYRVFIFFGVFAMAALVVRARAWRAWGPLAGAAALGGLLALPWAARLWRQAVLPVVSQPAGLEAAAGYNAFPVNYFQSTLERGWLAAAAVCLAWGLLARRPWLWAAGVWIGLVFGLVNIGDGTWLVNNNAWAISLFLPACLALGWGLHRATVLGRRRARRQAGRWWPRALAVVSLLLAAAAAGGSVRHGLRAQVAIVNPTTVLASAADADALAWIDANVPLDALFLVNGWNWQVGIWASPDGGGWLMPLTGRAATLPPLGYTFGPPAWRQAIEAFAQEAAAIVDASDPAAVRLLAARGVTHIYIGARGGQLRPEMFAGLPHYPLLYTNGAAWVFAFQPAPVP